MCCEMKICFCPDKDIILLLHVKSKHGKKIIIFCSLVTCKAFGIIQRKKYFMQSALSSFDL